ncbi:MAG TPA: holo-ACP synthase [Thermodesulfobacteriota bacterium]|nr:holo-ACP synthase [Thermodesulfobacteriota bacterium]
MIYGIGMDLVKVDRIRQALGRWGERFQNKVFTPGEIRYCLRKKDPHPSFAARFAAKEALVKALGIGIRRGVHWRDVEVQRGPLGRPVLKLHGKASELCREHGIEGLFLTLTHDGEYGGATVVLEKTVGAAFKPAPTMRERS